MCTAEGKGQHYDISKAGVWADCLRERRPVIHNDYASLPHRKGLPPGHAPILRQLAVPVLRGEKVTAILGVGNKATDYTDKDINIVSILADLIWDITERKRFEKELEDSRQQLETIIGITKTGIDIVDPDYNLLYVDPSWQKTYGNPKMRKCFEYFMGKDMPCQGCGIPVALKTKEVQITEETLVRENNRIVEVHTIPLLDKSGKWVVAEFNVDITERKRLEAEKAKLEEQNLRLQKSESLERMSGAIAHIFNNQLSVVQGYLQMVIGDLPPDDSRAVKLAKAMQAAIKASKVSGHLLFYLGQGQIKSEPLDLSELCRMNLPLLQAGKTGAVALETDLPSPGPSINADAKQIQQILTNLMFNAWEAIGDGAGTIRLTVKTVFQADIPALHRFPVDWRSKDQQYVCLEVTDSGCGIKGEDMDNLFDPFFSTKFTGRGMGLSVVLGIVKTHDAVITVENGIGCGSVFKVFFPMSVQMAPRQTEQIDRDAKIVPSGTILLVEDEDALREMTRVTLVHFGFTVLQAKDGVEAVEIFKTHKDEVSCLLCDLTMPRMGGWETISAVRAIRHDLPVVLASGYDEVTVMAGDHNELPDFFLNKPYDINKLSDTIGRAMARRAVLESSIVRKCESSEV
jgi:signal transduction histidine kinase/CheY-like chemotaxis protein